METTVEHRHLKNYCIIDFMQSNTNFYGSAKNIVGQYFWHYQIWGNQWETARLLKQWKLEEGTSLHYNPNAHLHAFCLN